MEENRLDECRKVINDVDREMVRLFEKRMEAARGIAAWKKEHGLPILDAEREKALLERNLSWLTKEEYRYDYRRFQQAVMEISKDYQRRLNEGLRVAYSGTEGAFAYIAARLIFPEAQTVPCADFAEAYRAVESGDCGACVLPIENSYAGEVDEVTDLLFTGALFVSGIYTLPVTQNLLALPGVPLSSVRRVFSHPQALSQCASFLKRHALEAVPASNTAVAARQVSEAGDAGNAAIASEETAALYGLEVLARGINESRQNATRFAVLTRTESPAPAAKGAFLLLFTVNHQPGALAEAIGVIAKYGFNMRALRSRPIREQPWQYYFYAEIEGNDLDEAGQKMMREMAAHCNILRVAGRFRPEVLRREEKTC